MAIPEIDSLEGVPTIVATPIYFTYHAMLSVNSITDGNGNRFRASHILFTNSNNTRIYVQKVAPNGTTILGHVQVALQIDGGIVKHDDFGLDYSGNDLIISNAGHALTPGQRKSPYCEARWVGVFENPGALTGTRGGASLSPDPEQEPNVTIDEIREVVRYEVERGNGRLADEFDENGIAAGLRSRPAEGMAYIMDPANHHDETAARWQDALFGFVKNANAGVQANILGGQDEWGQARRDELKQIIREVLAETSVLAELDTTEEEPS